MHLQKEGKMAYEIDFVGVGDECKKDADAIALRWKDGIGNYKIAVYDGGLQAHGEKLEQLLNQYYFDDGTEKIIDYVICSHSDSDHTSGLKNILDKFEVQVLYMNRPWLYVDDIWDKVNDGRTTKDSLIRRLRDEYQYINDLEEIAQDKGIPIYEAFQGTLIDDKLRILSPSKEFYLELLVESSKTPLTNESDKSTFSGFLKNTFQHMKNLIETWNSEKLRENVSTTAENEMSVVIYGEIDDNFLLTGDAGIRALDKSIKYSETIGKNIKENVNFIQVPHHGGRHNVSPSILNRLIGNVVEEGKTTGKSAFVSVANGSDHPLQMVVNAFIRRGVKVYKTKGNIIHHHRNMPNRLGWTALKSLEFEQKVEEWED